MTLFFRQFSSVITVFSLALVVAVCAAFAAPSAFASKLQDIIDRGTLRVGTTGDFRPMSIRNIDTDTYEGYDIDWTTQLAADMGVEIEFVATEWKTLVSGVAADRYDITGSASVNPTRALVAGYTLPYMEFGTVPMTLRKNLSRFSSWDDINKPDVSVAVTLGTVFDEEARQYFPKAKINAVEAPARDYQDVLAGRSIVSITSNLEAASLIKTYPEMVIIPVPEFRNKRPIAALVGQADQVWINYVNHWIRLKTAEGFFTELNARWLDQ